MCMESEVNVFSKFILFALQRTYKQIVHALIVALVHIDVAELDVHINADVVETTDIFLELDGRRGKHARAVVHRFVLLKVF